MVDAFISHRRGDVTAVQVLEYPGVCALPLLGCPVVPLFPFWGL